MTTTDTDILDTDTLDTAAMEAFAQQVATLTDRVDVEVTFCQGYPQQGYDLITVDDVLHDLGDPTASAAYARVALGSQAGAEAVIQVLSDAGFTRVRRAGDTPFHTVIEARP